MPKQPSGPHLHKVTNIDGLEEALNQKADKGEVYTKAEVDAMLAQKANKHAHPYASENHEHTEPVEPPIDPPVDSPVPEEPLNALDNPSAFGWPDSTNTGYSGELTLMGDLIVRDSTPAVDGVVVVDSAHISGRVQQKSSHEIRITNSWVEYGGASHLVDTRAGSGHVSFTDCKLDAGTGKAHTFGHEMTFTRCDMTGGEDAVDIWWNVNLYDCYVHDLYRSEDSHNDTFQSGGTGNSGAHHCTLLAAQRVPDGEGVEFPDGWWDPMNAVLMIGDYGGEIRGFIIEDSLCDGGNWMFNDNWRGDYLVENITIRNNRIGRHFRYGVKSLKDAPTDPNPPTWIWENNVWDDTGEFV